MVSRLPLLILLAIPLARAECPGAERLSEALALVATAHPVLLAERDAHAESQRQHDWKATLNLGYDTNDTYETGAAGTRAAVMVQIPLFDRSTRIEKAKARAALAGKEDATQAALLAAINALCEQAHQVRALETAQQFTRDRLTYRQERVNQGIDPADALWSEASAFQTAKHQWEQETAKLDTQRLTLARHYGGAEWQRLQVLLEAMTR